MAKHKLYDVITAWANGETIQYKDNDEWGCLDWRDFTSDGQPNFQSVLLQWRVKPKPKFVTVQRRLWMSEDGLVNSSIQNPHYNYYITYNQETREIIDITKRV